MKNMFIKAVASSVVGLAISIGGAFADEMTDKATALATGTIQAWGKDPAVVAAVKAQNAKHAGLTQTDIDALDKQWRAERDAASSPMIEEVLGNDLSSHLADIKESGGGLYTEIFVMDDKGLNVGQSDVTSDYWQGDEAKWQQTYQVGPDAIHLSDVELDESSQTYQMQISVTVVDGGAAIGAITVGVNADEM